MLKRIRDLNEVLPEVFFLDMVYLVIGEMIIFLAFPEPGIYAVGFLAGVLYSVFAVIQLSFRIRRVVYGKNNASVTLVIGYLIRLAVMLAIFGALYYLKVGDLLAALVGMFSMKITAYIQPVFNKFIRKLKKGG